MNYVSDALIDAQEREIKKLKAENAKLREEFDAAEGMIELPKDADGIPWNVGDYDEDGNEVTGLHLFDDGWWIRTGEICTQPNRHRHYHTPTVEDILREFALAVCKDNALTIRKGVVEEFAAKLQLKEN